MDISEFRHQVSKLLEIMQDHRNNFLGKDYTLTTNKEIIIETLAYEPARENTGSRTCAMLLLATPSPKTGARITRPLPDKLGILKVEGLGRKTIRQGVGYQFIVQDGEPRLPSYSSSSSSEDNV
jgi:hypothetical protein